MGSHKTKKILIAKKNYQLGEEQTQRNCNSDFFEISSFLGQKGYNPESNWQKILLKIQEKSHSPFVGMQPGKASLEISLEKSQKLKSNLPHAPAIPLLGVCPMELTFYLTNTSHPCSLLLYSQ